MVVGETLDYVITVCDRAKKACPVFPGDPEHIHWSFDDLAAVTEPVAQRRAFDAVARSGRAYPDLDGAPVDQRMSQSSRARG